MSQYQTTAHYPDGVRVNRGDVLIGADGQSYDFITAHPGTPAWGGATVTVRGMEQVRKPATFFGLRVITVKVPS